MRGKYQRRLNRFLKVRSPRSPIRRFLPALIVLIVLSLTALGGTLAFILVSPDSVTNSFEPGQMSCRVLEDFSDGINKKNVRIQNTGDAPAYIRVKLLPYWYDKEADITVAQAAWTPVFVPESGWVLGEDGFYYYTSPVPSGACTSVLIPSIQLTKDNVSLARQVLEILASCIQAEPADAVMDAWTGTNGSVTGVSDGALTIKQGA